MNKNTDCKAQLSLWVCESAVYSMGFKVSSLAVEERLVAILYGDS